MLGSPVAPYSGLCQNRELILLGGVYVGTFGWVATKLVVRIGRTVCPLNPMSSVSPRTSTSVGNVVGVFSSAV